MEKKYTIDNLTQHGVSVKTQTFAIIEGVEYEIGQPFRKSYVNSERGRKEIETDLDDIQMNTILLTWGNHPTVNEKE